jgi:hypothetical protein
LAGNSESGTEFQKAGRKFTKSDGKLQFRLTLPKVVRLFQKLSDFFKFRTTLARAGRKSKMRSDFENFQLEFLISVRLFRKLDNFFEFRPAFKLRDNFCQSGPEL